MVKALRVQRFRDERLSGGAQVQVPLVQMVMLNPDPALTCPSFIPHIAASES
jgi:hypothetical protein